MPRGRSVS